MLLNTPEAVKVKEAEDTRRRNPGFEKLVFFIYYVNRFKISKYD